MNRYVKTLKTKIEENSYLRELKYLFIGPVHQLTATEAAIASALEEIKVVQSCPEYNLIPRVKDAGAIRRGKLIMHNGVKVLPGSYYGYRNLVFLQGSGGIHEPQEEYLFSRVLEYMPAGATMLELGSFWSFYSLWFHQRVQQPSCFLVEPILSNLNYGKKNFALNGYHGDFTQAFVGRDSRHLDDGRQIAVDDFMDSKDIAHLDILHADIQGFELEMLQGAARHIEQRAIDYFFISTHSSDLHVACCNQLAQYQYTILADANLPDSYSPDGVIVARRSELAGLEPVQLSQRFRVSHTGD